MFLSRLATLGVAVFFSTTLGCALSSSPREETSSNEAAVVSESFILREDAATANSSCDVHTVLTLTALGEPTNSGATLQAHLRDEVSGSCRIYVDPDVRDYALVAEDAECGTRVYKATKTIAGDAREITLTDHRSRVCLDYRPAKIVVDETSRTGESRTSSAADVLR